MTVVANTSRRRPSTINSPLNVDAPVPPRLRGSPLLAQASTTVSTSKAKPSSSSYTPLTSVSPVVGANCMDGNVAIPHVPQVGAGAGPWLDFAELPTPPQRLPFPAINADSTLLHQQQRLRGSMAVDYPYALCTYNLLTSVIELTNIPSYLSNCLGGFRVLLIIIVCPRVARRLYLRPCLIERERLFHIHLFVVPNLPPLRSHFHYLLRLHPRRRRRMRTSPCRHLYPPLRVIPLPRRKSPSDSQGRLSLPTATTARSRQRRKGSTSHEQHSLEIFIFRP